MVTSPLSSDLTAQSVKILVADGNSDSSQALLQLLTAEGYPVFQTVQAAETLQRVDAIAPNIILLNTEIPNRGGLSVCETLRQSANTQDIPVIFFGPADRPNLRVRSFEVGGNDFIGMPLHAEEVLIRVQNQLQLYQRRQLLSQQNASLLSEVRERALIEASLRETELKYRTIFENVSEGIFQSVPDGGYINANPALAKIYGYDSVEDLMSSVTNIGQQLYVEPTRRAEILAYLRHYGDLSDIESEVYRKDGSRIWISETIHAVRSDSDGIYRMEGTVQDITEQRNLESALRKQRRQTERLLYNVLPYQIAQRLWSGANTIAESFDYVSVLFADLVEFTRVSTQMSPKDLVDSLNAIFSAFDQLVEQYKLEKIKTIGDEYMVAGGLPLSSDDHLEAIARLALSMQTVIQRFKRPDGTPFQLRIGISCGPVVAGVIGIKRFNYDLWGDTVNTASRMETTCLPNHIQVTQ
ncbi:MAG: adenylate/guanylate cyclase domain-containing protein, partial [Cyanobacteria bacterium P01_H01_bin.119]